MCVGVASWRCRPINTGYRMTLAMYMDTYVYVYSRLCTRSLSIYYMNIESWFIAPYVANINVLLEKHILFFLH